MAIMPEHYYGENYSVGNTEPVQEKNSEPMGSGPYLMAEYQPAEYVSMDRNPNYIFEDQYQINEIILKVVEMTTEMNELLTGSVDVLAGQIDPQNIESAKEDENI